MKRIRPDKLPEDREKAIAEFANDARMLMLASALIHHHQTGKIPFPPEKALKAFSEIADGIQKNNNMEVKPDPVKVANIIASNLMQELYKKECKGLTMPLGAFVSWMAFIPGGDISTLPCSGEIPIRAEDGEEFELYIDIDEDGKGGVYRYHDPESDSVRIGREYLLKIDPFGD